MKKSFIVLLILSLISVSCQRQPRLVILHTNDTHSHFEPIRSGEYACKGGVIERAALIDSVRNVYGEDKVLLLDAGDFSQGSSYFSEVGGELEIAILNDMKYDCVTLGNHEFDNNIEALEQRLAKLEGTKVVSANIDLSQFPISKYVSPYTVIERAGMKIGIIGLSRTLPRMSAPQFRTASPSWTTLRSPTAMPLSLKTLSAAIWSFCCRISDTKRTSR